MVCISCFSLSLSKFIACHYSLLIKHILTAHLYNICYEYTDHIIFGTRNSQASIWVNSAANCALFSDSQFILFAFFFGIDFLFIWLFRQCVIQFDQSWYESRKSKIASMISNPFHVFGPAVLPVVRCSIVRHNYLILSRNSAKLSIIAVRMAITTKKFHIKTATNFYAAKVDALETIRAIVQYHFRSNWIQCRAYASIEQHSHIKHTIEMHRIYAI